MGRSAGCRPYRDEPASAGFVKAAVGFNRWHRTNCVKLRHLRLFLVLALIPPAYGVGAELVSALWADTRSAPTLSGGHKTRADVGPGEVLKGSVPAHTV